jgi:multicomponent Na+:H+ antiporter subunit G
VLVILGQVVVAVMLLAGCLLALVAAVGLHRFPDLFCRMHGATKPASLGLLLVVIATSVTVTGSGSSIKLLLVVALQFMTAPVAAHMIGRAAYRSGLELTDLTVMDELGRERDKVNRYGHTE